MYRQRGSLLVLRDSESQAHASDVLLLKGESADRWNLTNHVVEGRRSTADSELLQAAHEELVDKLQQVGIDRAIRLKFCKTPLWHKTYSKNARVLRGLWGGHRGTGPKKGRRKVGSGCHCRQSLQSIS